MKIVCDNCGTKYSIADDKVRGKVFKIRCKRCSHIIVVKGTGQDQPQSAGFDQKETRVVEYGEGQGGDAGAVWHLVIDREQVGPMGVGEIQNRWQRGEVNKDTYAWREGMGDWLRLSAVPELAAALGDRTAPKADPSDLFGAASAEPAGDLFARAGASEAGNGGRATSSASADDLFSSASQGGGGIPTGAGGQAQVSSMTGQRNENSVLFSLNNLSAMASSAAPAPSGGAGAFTSNTGGREGSGLIDIRAMAATTLRGPGRAGGSSANATDDDLPVFSAVGFGTQAAPAVFLPGQNAKTDNKTLLIVVSVAAILILGLGGAAIWAFTRTPAAPVVAVREPVADPPAAAAAAGAEPAGGVDKVAAVAPGKEPEGKPPEPAAGGVAPTGDEGKVKEPERAPEPERPSKPETKREKREREKREKAEARARAARAKETPGEPAAAPAATGGCDEVECLVDPSQPCCKKFKKSGGGSASSSSSPSAAPSGGGGDLPAKLSRDDIKDGVAGVRGAVYACNDKYRESGIVQVKIVISASGKVSSATVTGQFAGTPTGKCVESAVKKASFKKFSGPSTTVSYPFSFK